MGIVTTKWIGHESEFKFDSPACSFLDQPNHAKVLLMIPKGLGEGLATARVLQIKPLVGSFCLFELIKEEKMIF